MSERKLEDGAKDYRRKLPPDRRKKYDSFWRENPICVIPPVVVAIPRVHVPLTVVRVPVHVHDEGTTRI